MADPGCWGFKLLTVWAGLTVVFAASPCQAESVQADRWAVATGHPEATAAGLAVLRDGGNAIDAAIAASLTLGVAEPYGSGLGGKLVLLYHDAASGEVTCIEALCPSATAMDVEAFVQLPSRDRKYGYRSFGVPGLPAGLWEAHRRWGEKPWKQLVAPAERLARRGIIVSETMRGLWLPHEKDLAADPEASRLFLVDGATPPTGARLPNPDLGETLARLVAGGAEGFYHGPTAEMIVGAARAAGAPISLEDFAGYQPRVTEPLAVNYRGYRVYSSPPPLTGGATVLAALRASELMGTPTPDQRNALYLDRFGRLLRQIYPRVTREIADTPDAAASAHALLQDESLRGIATRADQTEAVTTGYEISLDDSLAAGTTHLVVADAQGNLVSLTQSLSLHFGAAVVPPGTGVLLNDSMSNFATTWRESPNFADAGKRARSTVAPVIATRDGLPALALGLPGGQRIPTMTLQILADHLGAGVPLAEAFERPRWHLRRPTGSKQPKNYIDLEERPDEAELAALREGLKQRDWRTGLKRANGLYFGGGNAIARTPGGKLIAIADSRRTNHAAGD